MRLLSGRNADGRRRRSRRRLADPRIVVQRVDDAASCRSRDRASRTSDPCCRPTRARDHGQLAVVGHGRHAPADLALRLPGAPPPRPGGPVLGLRLAGAKLPSAHTVLPVFEVQHREQPAVLRVADVRARRDVLACSRSRSRSSARSSVFAPAGPLGDDDEDVRVVGREHQVRRRLAFLELERRELVLLLPSSSAFFFCSVCFADVLDELLLLVASGTSGCRSGAARAGAGRRRSAASMSAPAGQVGTMKRLPSRTKVTCVSLRAQRGIALGPGRPGDLAAGAATAVNQNDVAAVDEQDAAAAPCPSVPPAGRDRLFASSSVSLRGSPPSRPTT